MYVINMNQSMYVHTRNQDNDPFLTSEGNIQNLKKMGFSHKEVKKRIKTVVNILNKNSIIVYL